jgi:Zn finger protein HypA/HybF involved in hydrogenase expression
MSNEEQKFKNKAKCRKCGDIIESTYRHDFKCCTCGAIFVDGGNDLMAFGYDKKDQFERIYEPL